MIYISTALAVFWLGTLVHAQRHRRSLHRWQDTAISAYIKHDRTLQLGFIALAASLICAGLHFGGLVQWLFVASGIGAFGVMATMHKINGRLHVLAALTTYLAVLGAAVIASSGVLLGLAIGNALYAGFAVLIQDEIGDAERYIALGLISWLVGASVL